MPVAMRSRPSRGLALAGGAGLLLVVVVVALVASGQRAPLRVPPAPVMAAPPAGDPFVYHSDRASAFVARASAGEAHVLFSASPGGALATAARVARWRPAIEHAAAGSGIDPALLEALVFVESAGRPDAIAGPGAAGAAGLTQILAATASSMLGLHVDLVRSARLSQAIARARTAGAPAGALAALERRLAAADQRFDPPRALAATVRYLELGRRSFGRTDLALVSYHMGIGNLQRVLERYDAGAAVPYVQLFFDTAPDRHAAAYNILAGFSDQSWLYYWRLLAAERVMSLYRSGRAALAHEAALQSAQTSSAEVLHPPGSTPVFADPGALSAAYAGGSLRPLPANARRLGLGYAPSLGAQAHAVRAPGGLYRGLRPVALAVLLELSARVHALAPDAPALVVTSAVTDAKYQRLLGLEDPPAAAGYSFTLARPVGTAAAAALDAELGRMQALDLVAPAYFESEIEVTVASDAARVIAEGP